MHSIYSVPIVKSRKLMMIIEANKLFNELYALSGLESNYDLYR